MLCAFQFLIAPAQFAGAYQLSGVAGEAAVRALGVVFLMWNVTYPPFIAAPERFSVLGPVILVQQLLGFGGEALIFAGLPAGYEMLGGSILRFMAFDGAGLALMATAYFIFLRSASA